MLLAILTPMLHASSFVPALPFNKGEFSRRLDLPPFPGCTELKASLETFGCTVSSNCMHTNCKIPILPGLLEVEMGFQFGFCDDPINTEIFFMLPRLAFRVEEYSLTRFAIRNRHPNLNTLNLTFCAPSPCCCCFAQNTSCMEMWRHAPL
jgi:hypothetical protein